MEIPLTLRSSGPDLLVYGLPRWFRPVMALILALLAAGLALGGLRPGPMAWVILALVVLGGLYEESWSFDAAAGRVVRRAGLCFAPRRSVLPFEAIERFRLAAGPRSLDLVIDCADGSHLVDQVPARRRGQLRDRGKRIAALCGKPFSPG